MWFTRTVGPFLAQARTIEIGKNLGTIILGVVLLVLQLNQTV